MGPWLDFVQKLILLVVGFALTTVCGALISSFISRRAWSRQTRIDLFASRYKEGVALHDDLADAVGERFFALQRLTWAINAPHEYDLKSVRDDYFAVVKSWNKTSRKFRSKIRVLVGEQQALAFLDYGDDARGQQPKSIHYLFVVTGRTVLSDSATAQDRQRSVDRLNHRCSRFIDELTTVFVERANRLALLAPVEEPRYPADFDALNGPAERRQFKE